jgi:hypothetical protein
MRLSLDITTDFSGRELYSFLSNTNVPQYVKEADLDENFSALPREAFADKGRKAFPVHTKEATFLSNVYITNKKTAISKALGKDYIKHVESEITKAAELFDIQEDIKSYNEAVFVKEASDYDQKYLYNAVLTETDGTEKVYNLFPVKTASDLTSTAQTFAKEISNYPMSWRFDICENMLKAAEDLGVDDLPDVICKYAGMFYPDVPSIRQELWRRSKKIKLAEDKETYEILVKEADNIHTMEDVKNLSEIVYHLELRNGLYDSPKTASLLPDPIDTFFSMPIEKVANMLSIVEMGGTNFHLDDLSKISKNKYAEAFGIDIDPTNKQQLMDVLPTMPRSDVQIFRELTHL